MQEFYSRIRRWTEEQSQTVEEPEEEPVPEQAGRDSPLNAPLLNTETSPMGPVIFSFFKQNLTEFQRQKALDVDALRALSTLKISFFYGFGFPYFQRGVIQDTPAWIDIQNKRAADLLDEVLREHDNKHRRPSLPDHLNHGTLASSQSSSSFSFTDEEPAAQRSDMSVPTTDIPSVDVSRSGGDLSQTKS